MNKLELSLNLIGCEAQLVHNPLTKLIGRFHWGVARKTERVLGGEQTEMDPEAVKAVKPKTFVDR